MDEDLDKFQVGCYYTTRDEDPDPVGSVNFGLLDPDLLICGLPDPYFFNGSVSYLLQRIYKITS